MMNAYKAFEKRTYPTSTATANSLNLGAVGILTPVVHVNTEHPGSGKVLPTANV